WMVTGGSGPSSRCAAPPVDKAEATSPILRQPTSVTWRAGCAQDPPIVTRKCELTKCPQDGDWSLWSEWSQCTASCGQGVRTRTRTCDSPRPLHGGKDFDGGWSEWNDYGFCRAARCDWGYRLRRACAVTPDPNMAALTARATSTSEWTVSTTRTVPRNGSWCPWSEWSACSSSCAEDTSLKVRQRTCMCPEPRFGGNDCEGLLVCSVTKTWKSQQSTLACFYANQSVVEFTLNASRKSLAGSAGTVTRLEGSGMDGDCDQ
ncbi:hypothetical protein BaRGS_00015102, partial [Batillaria attramentaria]